ncbi:MAG: hemerythrin family protein [Rhodospirillales bacterium]|nr:hemerythrin family protein [Rhodospirillales bacterium]
MSKITWTDDLATGVDQIDAHNQSLLYILDELFASDMPCEMRSRMCHKIEDTIVYLTRNFLREEALMVECDVPDAEGHKREHRTLLDELLRLQRTLECGRYDTSEMFDLISSWVLAHIEIWDKELGRRAHANPGLAIKPDALAASLSDEPRSGIAVGAAE